MSTPAQTHEIEDSQVSKQGASSANESTIGVRLRRRSLTVPGILLGLPCLLVLLTPVLLVGGLIDLVVRRRGSTVRISLYAVWLFAIESVGIVVAGLLWLRFAPSGQLRGRASLQAHSRLLGWWATNLVRGARTLLGMRHFLEGRSNLDAGGPLIVLARHGRPAASLLVVAILAESGLRPRFVIARELLWDPCLDIVGHRIPNYFVDRDSFDNREELGNIARLAAGLANDEALVIFPEGTNFSRSRRDRAIEVLGRTAPEREASARRLTHVLPIRTSGLLSVLETDRSADLLFLNHVGVEDFHKLRDLWRNVPFPTPLSFSANRTSRQEVPDVADKAALVRWLDARWEEFDSWVTTNSSASS
jgi:1-acyl-sn-glycerol-3-phosphate acyltransferase|tara:strand:- start:503 stop:1588 length:1086 start_codon:yes stop_codon:yes gene_type:complete